MLTYHQWGSATIIFFTKSSISQNIPQPTIIKISLNIIHLKLQANFPNTNEVIRYLHNTNIVTCIQLIFMFESFYHNYQICITYGTGCLLGKPKGLIWIGKYLTNLVRINIELCAGYGFIYLHPVIQLYQLNTSHNLLKKSKYLIQWFFLGWQPVNAFPIFNSTFKLSLKLSSGLQTNQGRHSKVDNVRESGHPCPRPVASRSQASQGTMGKIETKIDFFQISWHFAICYFSCCIWGFEGIW